jgi:hypothetical protein
MTEDAGGRQTARFFGGLLMAAGVLIAVTAGLCTLIITAMGLTSPQSNMNDMMDSIPIVVGAGVIPCGFGVTLFFIGRRLFRGPR